MEKNKYNAERVNYNGISFASKGERDCELQYLRPLEQAGKIKIVRRQAHVHLTDAEILYIADWQIFDYELNENVWVEFKGFETPVWRIKRNLWEYYGPGRLRVFKGYGGRMKMVEEIRPHSVKESLFSFQLAET